MLIDTKGIRKSVVFFFFQGGFDMRICIRGRPSISSAVVVVVVVIATVLRITIVAPGRAGSTTPSITTRVCCSLISPINLVVVIVGGGDITVTSIAIVVVPRCITITFITALLFLFFLLSCFVLFQKPCLPFSLLSHAFFDLFGIEITSAFFQVETKFQQRVFEFPESFVPLNLGVSLFACRSRHRVECRMALGDISFALVADSVVPNVAPIGLHVARRRGTTHRRQANAVVHLFISKMRE
mmetsp:Transcript_2259/g.4843  ORF Transcript_2259/g.4843 Transcript_2259/m.4843 type:complete len:241 (+) Transcript_2259:2926-3648(+)